MCTVEACEECEEELKCKVCSGDKVSAFDGAMCVDTCPTSYEAIEGVCKFTGTNPLLDFAFNSVAHSYSYNDWDIMLRQAVVDNDFNPAPQFKEGFYFKNNESSVGQVQ